MPICLISINALSKHFQMGRGRLTRTKALVSQEEWEQAIELALDSGLKPFYSIYELSIKYGCSRRQMLRIIQRNKELKKVVRKQKIVVLIQDLQKIGEMGPQSEEMKP